MQHNPDQKNVYYQGNALIIILVLIGLLAALTGVAMKSSNRSTSNMDVEMARIQGEKLMRQAKNFESGLLQLMTVNQCSENEISFENTLTTRNYTNASAPTDHTCDLFHSSGAGLSYTNPNDVLFDTSRPAKSDFGQWVFTASHCVLKIGSDDDDACNNSEVALIAIVPHINLTTCLQINTMNGITNPAGAPPEESYDETSAEFTGTYVATTDPELGETAAGIPLVKHTTGCFENTSGAWTGSYIYYNILLSR